MIVAEAARRHEVTEPWVREIRDGAGISPSKRFWTDHERQFVVTYQDRPVRDQAALLGRSERAVFNQRTKLIAKGVIVPKIMRTRKPAR